MPHRCDFDIDSSSFSGYRFVSEKMTRSFNKRLQAGVVYLVDDELNGSDGITKLSKSLSNVPICIEDCDESGAYVTFINRGYTAKQLHGMRVNRTIDGKNVVDFTIDVDRLLEAGEKITIWAKGQKPSSAPREDFEANLISLGVGMPQLTILCDKYGKKSAFYSVTFG